MRITHAIAVLGLAASTAHADDKGTLGVGIVLGEPTGVSAKLYIEDDQAIQAAVGSAFVGGGLQLHVDYVFHPFVLQSRDAFVLPFYVGPGVRAIEYLSGPNNTFAIGVRAVAGIVVDFKDIPLDAFLEVAGVFEFESGGDGFGPALNAGAGARYYF